MGKIFYIMGKSATGKDTIYEELLEHGGLGLLPFIMYTACSIILRTWKGFKKCRRKAG